MKRSALIGSLAAGIGIAGAAVLLTLPGSFVIPLAMAQPGPPGITPERLATTLTRVGLTAENLAAVGADGSATTGVVAGMRAYLEAYGVNLYEADQAMAGATATHDQLLRLVQRGQRDQQTLDELSAARASLAAATLALETELDAAFDQAASGLTAGQRTLIERIHGNEDAYHMPTEFAAASWTEGDWLDLRGALTHLRQNETPDPAAQALVDDAMALTDIATADSNLSTSLGTCTSAWETAVQTYGGT